MADPTEDHLLDHNYDGIQEYDNPLPGWWVWIFWATILFSVIYFIPMQLNVWLYEQTPSVQYQYEAAAAAAMEVQAARLAELDVNEDLIAGLMVDEQGMAGMRAKFVAKCATCHKDKGQGDACPNLTDEYWLHGGSLVEIFETIRDGVPGKEMQSWLADLGPGGVLTMAAYVGTLRNTNVPGKKREGSLYRPAEKSTPAVEGQPKAGTK